MERVLLEVMLYVSYKPFPSLIFTSLLGLVDYFSLNALCFLFQSTNASTAELLGSRLVTTYKSLKSTGDHHLQCRFLLITSDSSEPLLPSTAAGAGNSAAGVVGAPTGRGLFPPPQDGTITFPCDGTATRNLPPPPPGGAPPQGAPAQQQNPISFPQDGSVGTVDNRYDRYESTCI